MSENDEGLKVGDFYFCSKTVPGKLTLDGERSELYLYSKGFLNPESVRNGSIYGTLSDTKKVSLINCITLSSGNSGGVDESRNYLSVFPHYIILGDRYLDPSEKKVDSIFFTIEDSSTLFDDRDAFGFFLGKDVDTKGLLEDYSNKTERKFEVGEHPEVFYYSGKYEIFNVSTCLGRVSSSHRPSWVMPSPKGIRMENSIPIIIEFDQPVIFEEAVSRFNIVKNFVDLIIGKPQHVESISISIDSEDEYQPPLEVYSTMQEKKSLYGENEPHSWDVLINGGVEIEGFPSVLSSWLDRQSTWRNSRWQFINSFRKKNRYSPDRLVAAANMFDILPEDATGKALPMPESVSSALKECKEIFKSLPACDEKNSALSALGRIGKHNLKTKIKFRASLITERVGDRFPDLDLVINEAINCRNFYVHGSDGKLPTKDVHRFSNFVTDTLEFIYGASDLLEAGWDIRGWLAKGSTLSHPYSQYVHSYQMNLDKLKETLK